MDGEGPRIALNGCGRIGRLVIRALLGQDKPVDLIAINDMADRDTLAHLFKYDSVHGKFPGLVDSTARGLRLEGDNLVMLQEPNPANLPWRQQDVDLVIEATGKFTHRDGLESHLKAGAPRVLLTAPGDVDLAVVRGVNDRAYKRATHRIVGTASCTTNCLAPVLKVLDDNFKVESGLMTTVHAVTNDQAITDSPHKDLRRARGSLLSMIPTATGAARAIGKVMPHLAGKIDGMSVRVPTPDVSLLDLTVRLGSSQDMDTIKDRFRHASTHELAGILGVAEEPLVSADFVHDPRSAVVDMPSMMVMGDTVKVLAWYDNEWAYANRVAEMAMRMAP